MADRPIGHWKQLRASGGGDGTLEVPSISSGVETGYGPVRFAVGPDGEPRLLVPCGPSGLGAAVQPTGKLAVTLARFTLAGRATSFIDVMSLDRPLDAVFAELADEILHRIENGSAPVAAVESTISDFKELLREGADQVVSHSQIIGLLGELVVLRKMAEKSPAAIEAWTGPYDQRHDFRRRLHAVEVKTSARADSTTVTISSSEQLAEPVGGTLTLIHVRVERADAGELCVSALFQALVECGVDRSGLQSRLAAIGCLDPHAHDWNGARYCLEGLAAYRVQTGFPRITGSLFSGGAMPEGIIAVSYELDLRAAQAFLLSETEVQIVLQRIVE